MAIPKVYVETSVISYLTAKPSRDLIVAAHQQVTMSGGRTKNGLSYSYLMQFSKKLNVATRLLRSAAKSPWKVFPSCLRLPWLKRSRSIFFERL